MDLFAIITLGVVEGLTEFLPISSTAHLLIAEKLMNINAGEFFNIGIQMGAILAVVAYAPRRLLLNFRTQIAIVLAFIPTAIIGFLVKDYSNILHSNIFILILSLFIGGIIMLILENKWKPNMNTSIEELSTKKSFIIGAIQAIAFIPGVSRSAATIYAGLSQGLTKKEALSFSFFLGIPTMAAATFMSLLKIRNEISINSITPVLLGAIVAFIVALIVMHVFIKWIEKHGFKLFAWYRIVLAIILFVIFI